MNYVNLLTKNPGKIKAAESALSPLGIEIRIFDLALPEIQADTSLEIARFAARNGYDHLLEPVIREDHSFTIHSLGIPGPYMAYMHKAVDVQRLTRALSQFEDSTAHYTVSTIYIDNEGEELAFSYDIPVVLERIPRGPDGPRWERIIRLPGEDRVFAEYPEEERIEVFNQNYRHIAETIASGSKEVDYQRRK